MCGGCPSGGVRVKKLTAFLAVFLIFSAAFCARAVSAKAYALVDQASGRLIAGQDVDEELPMASTTKIMTALLAVESGKLDQTITVPAEAINVEGSSMGLRPDETITLRDVVYGLMLSSGNDAANTIAFVLGGSIEGFASRMNSRAQQLGLYHTHFMNPSGLDAQGHYTTALDLARLGADAMENPDFRQIVGTKKISVTYDGIRNGRTLTNHNRLLGTLDGVIGIKTGHTRKSGRCLVTCATRNGVTLVLSTLSDPDDWDDHTALLDQGFASLTSQALTVGRPVVSANVVGGTRNSVSVVCDPDVTAALRGGEAARVTEEVDMPRFVYAPVAKGQTLGEVVFRVDGEKVASAEITATGDVPYKQKPPGFLTLAVRFFRSLFARR